MQLSPLPERQRVRKFKTTNRHAELIDKNDDFDDDDHAENHHVDHKTPATAPTDADVATAPAAEVVVDAVKAEGSKE
jgi:hypothetical protein